jgi:putative membrane protein
VTELSVLTLVLLVAAADLVGRARHPGHLAARARGTGQTWSFYLGLLAVLVALEGPLDHAAETSQSWHMAQHLVLLAVAAPLLVLGAPLRRMAWMLPEHWESRLRRNRVLRTVSGATAALAAIAIIVQSAVLAAWHLPGPYQAAIRNPFVHVLEHLTFLGAGLLLWWAILHASRAQLGMGVLALFIAALPGTALGLLMTVARTVWYPVYGTGSSALGDQQLAGVVMWAVGNTMYLIAAVALFVAWLSSLERTSPARPASVRS